MSNECSDMPICDFCVFFDWDSAFDRGGVNVASGLCYKHSIMKDASDGCLDFICKICAKDKFCQNIMESVNICHGFYEGKNLHPMCVKCRKYRP